jgi:hypothetical protein
MSGSSANIDVEVLPPNRVWISTSSSVFGLSNDPCVSEQKFTDNSWATFKTDQRIHSGLLQAACLRSSSTSLLYLRVGSDRLESNTPNSSFATFNPLVEKYYDAIEHHLNDILTCQADEYAQVEAGAVKTALIVLGELRHRHFAPPEVTSHGSDAVVMLWALGDTTYAITATDGEVGYVVRKNRKRFKVVHSIQIDKFKALELK